MSGIFVGRIYSLPDDYRPAFGFTSNEDWYCPPGPVWEISSGNWRQYTRDLFCIERDLVNFCRVMDCNYRTDIWHFTLCYDHRNPFRTAAFQINAPCHIPLRVRSEMMISSILPMLLIILLDQKLLLGFGFNKKKFEPDICET